MISTLVAAASRHVNQGGLRDVKLSDLLANTAGLTTNANGETYATANQFTTNDPGDGKRYDIGDSNKNRRIKSISANFRYTASNPSLSAFCFYYKPDGAPLELALGLYDEWNNQAGFRLVSDIHNRVLTQSSFNGELKKTFAQPVRLDQIYVKVGGRNGYGFSPIYMKDLKIEYV